jgi:PAS domain S-box-containing protein
MKAETHVLVAEDEIIIAKEIQNSLRDLGYPSSTIVKSGEEAIKKTFETQPDLILMDIMLQGQIDGIQAAEHIRERFDVPIIYLTAYSDDKTLERAKRTEPSGYILKPFQETELRTTIKMALYKHKMERRLKEREQWYLTVLRSIVDAVITTDEKGIITFMNPIAEALTGWVYEEALGKHLSDVYIIADNTNNGLDNREDMFLTIPHEKLLVVNDGTRIPIHDSNSPIRDHRGNIIGTLTVFRDITERKKLEQQLMQAQKMEAIGQLAGGIAHDFNNILTAIIGYGKLLEEMKQGDPSNIYVTQILNSAQKAAKLTQGLLTFSRKQIINPQPVNLNEIVKNVENLLGRLIGDNISLTIVLSEEDLLVVADAIQIEQILMNLVTNARDAMPHGGTVTVKTEMVKFDSEFIRKHGYGRQGQYALISIKDTGQGMDDKTKTRIFEPFFTTKEVGRGTGLGLSMVYGIVQQHNGDVLVSSESGKGTIFKIYFPICIPCAEKGEGKAYNVVKNA